MSVDTKLLIATTWHEYDIYDIVRSIADDGEVKQEESGMVHYNFRYKGEARILWFFKGSDGHAIPSYCLSLGLWGHAHEIMETIGKRIGGLWCKNDSTDDYVELRSSRENFLYWINKAFLEGAISTKELNDESMAELIAYLKDKKILT